jgi:hypothetical protein
MRGGAGRNVPSMLAVTVKPFDQPQFHATVTICPELKIPNQKVTQKSARTVGARDCRTLCANCCARDPPGLSSIPGGVKCGSVQVAIFDGQTVLPFPRVRRRTVKPFKQCELHGTVTICPEIKIPNQKVTQKSARTVGARDCRTLCANAMRLRASPPRPVQATGGSSADRCGSQCLIVRPRLPLFSNSPSKP